MSGKRFNRHAAKDKVSITKEYNLIEKENLLESLLGLNKVVKEKKMTYSGVSNRIKKYKYVENVSQPRL